MFPTFKFLLFKYKKQDLTKDTLNIVIDQRIDTLTQLKITSVNYISYLIKTFHKHLYFNEILNLLVLVIRG